MPVVALLRTCLGLGPTAPEPSPEERSDEGPDLAPFTFDPQPGRLTTLTGSLPTPAGRVRVALRRSDGTWHADLSTPVAVAGPDRSWDPGVHHIERPGQVVRRAANHPLTAQGDPRLQESLGFKNI